MATSLIQLIISWLTLAAALWVACQMLDGMSIKGDYKGYLAVAALFGVLNFFLGWVLFTFLGIATLGLGFIFHIITLLVVDAIVLKLADSFSDRLKVRSFGVAILASLIISLVTFLAEKVTPLLT